MKKVAVLGCGIVGTGIVEILSGNPEGIAKNLGEEIELKYILERRDCSGESYAGKVVDDFEIILNDPGAVVELMGKYGEALLTTMQEAAENNPKLIVTLQ